MTFGQTRIMACMVLLLALAACGGGGGGTSDLAGVGTSGISTSSSTSDISNSTLTGPPTIKQLSTHAHALAIWREGNPAQRPKGSCMGCHGADFFDLARIGSSRQTTIRRATTDGATKAEAEILADAIDAMRVFNNLPVENPQTFRPFQPGG